MVPEAATREIYLHIEQVWIMYVLLVVAMAAFFFGVFRRYKLWVSLGKPEDRKDQWQRRLGRVAAYALGHVSLMREAAAGLMHGAIFWGMMLLVLGTTVVAIEADLGLPVMRGWFYLIFQSLILDLAGALALVGLGVAAVRRYALKVPRLQENRIVNALVGNGLNLLWLALIMVQGFMIEALRIEITQDPWRDWSPVGSLLGSAIGGAGFDVESLIAIYQFWWWFHLVTVFGWIAYLPYSKMFHILTSPVNIYFASLNPAGNMLKPIDFEATDRLGASALTDFTWKSLLDLDACTSCGRCQAMCPAYASEKPLSPRSLILDLRDHMTRIGPRREESGKEETEGTEAMVGEAVKEETLWSCTTCRACMEACPVLIEHIPKIVEMRRYLAMEQASMPETLQEAILNLENRAHPYKGASASRTEWAEGLDVPIMADVQDVEVLYWVGCTAAFDPRNQKVARAMAKILKQAGVKFGILGSEEQCTGDVARRAGQEFLFETIARQNVETLKSYKFDRIVTACPHCLTTLKYDYRDFDGNFEVVHHTQFIRELVQQGKLPVGAGKELESATFHDPCYLGRYNDETEAPRDLLRCLTKDLREMERCGKKSFCCGAGGGHAWMEEEPGKPRVNQLRAAQALQTGASHLATGCPFCLQMMEDGVKAKSEGDPTVKIRDVAELVAAALDENKG